MENMPSTSSSSPATSRPSAYRPFDVFINHHGDDSKKTLASHIYYALENRGIRVFLDKDRMETGELITAQLEDAIRNASVHIAIFSKNYAASPWCLKELCLMMENPDKILAVFYGVEPCDLRWMDKDGPYAKAFKTHQEKKRYEAQTLEEWKRALFNAAGRSGYELQKGFNGDEGALVNHIVNNVLKRVKRPPLHVAKYPVGLDEVAEDFEKTMLLLTDGIDEENVKVVGIVGMGGAGKTTLAKHLFNNKRSSYGRSSFLFDVRSSSLTDLQSQLLKDLTGVDEKIHNISEGIGILKNQLSYCQALVVLDDIDDVNQLEALLVVKDVLRLNSLILVTSRERGLLRGSQILSLYDMRKLDKHHARQLFCWHALLRPFPTEGFNELVEGFLTVCDGLPLALQVLGALVYGKNIAYWTSQLQKVARRQERDIKERLRVSYDALDEDDQEMFLDVACFFIGKEKDTVIRIWDGCGWNGLLGLHTLESKCLIELGYQERIRMHDQLRDMGRDIVDEEANKPRRLWRPNDVRGFHRRSRTTQDVRGILSPAAPFHYKRNLLFTSLDGCKEVLGICVEFFRRLMCERSGSLAGEDGLKLLVVEGGDSFKGIWRTASTGLVWLSWRNCPYRSLPLQLHPMEQLRVLELTGGQIETPWHGSKGIPAQLRELTMRYCSVKIPKSIEQLKFLEKLVLSYPGGCMKSLPDEFCRLQSLKHLELCFMNLELLPQNFGDLTNLEHLDLDQCENLQALPDSFSRLLHLRYLSLRGCKKLNFRQDCLRNILALEHADFSKCESLEVLPIHITHQTSLEILQLYGASLKELPNEIGDLRNLKVLELGSPCLSSLPSSIWNLSRLTMLCLSNCTNLKRYHEDDVDDATSSRVGCLRAGFEHMRFLEYVEVRGCPFTEVIPFTNVVRKLEKEETMVVDSRDSSGLLSKLEDLWLIDTKLSSISIAENVCPNLTSLHLGFNIYLAEVEDLPNALKRLRLPGCRVLKRILGLSNLAKLLDLNINGCGQLEELPDLEQLSSLETFDANGCLELKELPNVSQLTSLKALHVADCWKLKSIKGLEKLKRLEELNISAGNGAIWNDIQFLQRLPHSKLSWTSLTTRAVPGVEGQVESIVGSLSSPLSIGEKADGTHYARFKVSNIKSVSAMMLCILFKASGPGDSVRVTTHQKYYLHCHSFDGEGEWIGMSISTRGSEFIRSLKGYNAEQIYIEGDRDTVKVKQVWMVTARDEEEQKKVFEIWNALFYLMHSHSSLC